MSSVNALEIYWECIHGGAVKCLVLQRVTVGCIGSFGLQSFTRGYM